MLDRGRNVLLVIYQNPMIDVNDEYDTLVGARLLDFFGTRTHWHRRLWTIGLVLTLKELPGPQEPALFPRCLQPS